MELCLCPCCCCQGWDGPAELKPDSKRQRLCFLLAETISGRIYQTDGKMGTLRQVTWNLGLKNTQDIKADVGRDRTRTGQDLVMRDDYEKVQHTCMGKTK